MKSLVFCSFVLVAVPVAAQDYATSRPSHDLRRDTDVPSPVVSGPLNPTAEMWFYSQETRRGDDPKMAVRRKAEARAAGRTYRLESLAWQGLSTARPNLSLTPIYTSYMPNGPGAWWTAQRNGTLMYQPIGVTR